MEWRSVLAIGAASFYEVRVKDKVNSATQS